ncbi:MAG: diguanylate cyclase [Candidatus Sumerlaeota bacterium]|nr:diguanylate cyclase [Candidatus Sumerlaeota bacterium]
MATNPDKHPDKHPEAPEQARTEKFISALRGEQGGAVRVRRADLLLSDPDRQIGRILANSRSVMIVHAQGRVIYANPPVARFFGVRDPAELAGRTLEELVAPEDHPTVHEIVERVGQRRAATTAQRIRFVKPEGGELLVEARSLPIAHEGRMAVITMGHEIPRDEEAASLPAGPQTNEVLAEDDFREILAFEQRRAGRTGLPLSLLLLQPDTDAASHSRAASVPIGPIAEACQRTLRASDHVGLADAGTAGLILPITDLEGAGHLARRLRRIFAEMKSPSGTPAPLPPCSGGAVLYSPTRDADAEAFIFRARAALAEARHLGGNQSVEKE